MKKGLFYILLLTLVATGCGTGIESTKAVSEKDVKKALAQRNEGKKPTPSLTLRPDSVALWQAGKLFYVTDDQARLIFAHSNAYCTDSLHLAGRRIAYKGYDTESMLDNRKTVTLEFTDGNNTYSYRTNRTMSELHRGYSIPFLIEMDVVEQVAAQITGKEFWVKTRIWYDAESEKMIDGRQFVKVKIDSVLPGNKVLPLKVKFTTADTGEQAMVWLSTGHSAMHSRDFDSQFSRDDLHKSYPEISNENWAHITRGELVLDMSKEECRLAKGAPKNMVQHPDQTGLREYWYYDGGGYLYFQDGLLKQFRE